MAVGETHARLLASSDRLPTKTTAARRPLWHFYGHREANTIVSLASSECVKASVVFTTYLETPLLNGRELEREKERKE